MTYSSGIDALKFLRGAPGNAVCADCSDADPEWASVNLGVVLCAACAAVHRDLGNHVSRVRSVVENEWSMPLLKMLGHIGNAPANQQVWEAALKHAAQSDNRYAKPGPSADGDELRRYIVAKYIDRIFLVCGEDVDDDSLGPALYESVRTDNIIQTLHLIALGANPNFRHTDVGEAGRTALHAAAANGSFLQAALLVANGASLEVIDDYGHSPEQSARFNGHEDLANWLQECTYELTDCLSKHLSNYMILGGPFSDTPAPAPTQQRKGSTPEPALAPERMAARQRLGLLSEKQFHELASDVYDEVNRRESDNAVKKGLKGKATSHHVITRMVVPFLPVNPHFPPQRNQSRQKLATLSTTQFIDLVADVLYETERRGAELDKTAQAIKSKVSFGLADEDPRLTEKAAKAAAILRREREDDGTFDSSSREVIDSLAKELATMKMRAIEAEARAERLKADAVSREDTTRIKREYEENVAQLEASLHAERDRYQRQEKLLLKLREANELGDLVVEQMKMEHDGHLRAERDKIAVLEAEIAALKGSARGYASHEEAQAASDRAALAQARAEVQRLQSESESFERRLADVRADLEAERARTADAQSRMNDAITAATSMAAAGAVERDALREEIRRLRDENALLRAREKDSEAVSAELADLRALSARQRVRCEELEIASTAHRQTMLSLEERNAQLHRQVRELQQQLVSEVTPKTPSSPRPHRETPAAAPAAAAPVQTSAPPRAVEAVSSATQSPSRSPAVASPATAPKAAKGPLSNEAWKALVDRCADEIASGIQLLFVGAKAGDRSQFASSATNVNKAAAEITGAFDQCPNQEKFRTAVGLLSSNSYQLVQVSTSAGDARGTQAVIMAAYDTAKAAKALVQLTEI